MPRRFRNPLLAFILTDAVLIAWDLAQSASLLLT